MSSNRTSNNEDLLVQSYPGFLFSGPLSPGQSVDILINRIDRTHENCLVNVLYNYSCAMQACTR